MVATLVGVLAGVAWSVATSWQSLRTTTKFHLPYHYQLSEAHLDFGDQLINLQA
jgi:hypothetical protein